MPEPMELAYEERGSGPVAVFVHGFPLDRTMWIGQLSGLAKVRTAVALDLRGHGLSEDPNPGNYSMDLFADDIAATLDAMGAEKADLVGLSMGGYVVFAFWRRHRDRVRSLVFCDTKAEADSDEAKKAREATADKARTEGLEPIWEGLKTKMFGPNPSDDVLERVHKMFLGVPPEVAAADALAMRDRPDSTGDLAGIDVPVLWIHGDDDQLMSMDAARAAADKIADSRFVTIPGGHMAPMESPAEANAAMTEFFKTVGK
jgi:pimeloyl-ACP methyl ester carboxylesterase